MAATNAELLERKKSEAAQQAAEDRRIAAYLADKAARDQVGVCAQYLLILSISKSESDSLGPGG